MRRFSSHRLVALAFIGFAVLSLFISNLAEKVKQPPSESVFEKQSNGTDLFFKLVTHHNPHAITLLKGPIHHPEALKTYSKIFILAPTEEISEIESKHLEDYVNQGGQLYISLHAEKHFQSAALLLAHLNKKSSTRENPSFKNGVFQTATADSEKIFWASKSQAFAVYSPSWFDRVECTNGNLECYVKEESFGKGRVTIVLGFALFANGLLEKAENRVQVFEWIRANEKILIDEYHHGYSDHTFVELLKEPRFGLPSAGLFLLMIGFLALGYHPLRETIPLREKNEAPLSFHHFNHGILFHFFKNEKSHQDALKQHLKFLKRHLDSKAFAELEKQTSTDPKNFQKEALRQIAAHQHALKEREGIV